jgi:hypothetical protein
VFFYMKNIYWSVWSLVVMAMAAGAQGQPAVTTVRDGRLYEAPKSDFVSLRNSSGEVRVLDARGLLLESNLTYLPLIQLSDLSQAELEALLETKTAYAALTAYGSLRRTNAQSAAIENQLRQAWQRGGSLAEKMQTRLDILADLREYNYNLGLLQGSVATARQDDALATAVYDQQTNRAAMVATAAAHVDAAEQEQASGVTDSRLGEMQAKETYQEMAERLARANGRTIIADGQAANANQQVTDHLANCAAISAHLASQGIIVPAAPPFYPIPPLMMQPEVDAARVAN